MVKVLKLAPRHPRHGGTFVKIHREQADVSIVRNVPAKATLPTLPSQKPRTALTVSCLCTCAQSRVDQSADVSV